MNGRVEPVQVGLQLDGVSQVFDQQPTPQTVLSNVSLTIQPGEFIAIIGPSGVGKTTLLRLLAGIDSLQSGQIRCVDQAGHDVGLHNVVYHPQRDVLFEWQRVLSNATLGARLAGVPRDVAQLRAEIMLRDWGLGEVIRAWPYMLSGGMRQRVAMVRTLLTPRPVLALDEPFGALDALTRQSMQYWLQRLRTHERRTVVMVTHDIDEALAVSSRIVVLTGRPGVISHIESVPQVPIHANDGSACEVSAFGALTLNDRLDSPEYRTARRRLTDSLTGSA